MGGTPHFEHSSLTQTQKLPIENFKNWNRILAAGKDCRRYRESCWTYYDILCPNGTSLGLLWCTYRDFIILKNGGYPGGGNSANWVRMWSVVADFGFNSHANWVRIANYLHLIRMRIGCELRINSHILILISQIFRLRRHYSNIYFWLNRAKIKLTFASVILRI